MPNNTLEKWDEKTLGELCDVLDSRRKPITKKDRVAGVYPYYGATGILDYVSGWIFDEELVLLGEDGAKWTSGEQSAFKINGKTWVNNHAHVLRPKRDRISDTYLIYNLNFQNLMPYITGTTVPKLNQEKMRSITIPLPPLPEQERIVAKLDKAFEAIDKAKTIAETNLKNAKELFESYANAILFSEKDSIKTTIGETCMLMTGGTPNTKKGEYYKNGTIKWLVSGDIHLGEINDCEGRITELGLNNSNAKYLPVNSVLIALNGQGKTRGTVALLKTMATCNQSLVSINPKDKTQLNTEYLYQNLRARYIEIRRMTGDDDNDRRGLNMSLIRSIRINIPRDIKVQILIAEKLKNLQEQTKQLEAIYTQKIKDFDELKHSILQKAFRGEL